MAMKAEDVDRIIDWVVDRGLAGDDEITLLHDFCRCCCEAGLPISRGIAIIDTLDPVYEGRTFAWNRDKELEKPVSEYEPTREGPTAEAWRRSPFFHLLESGESEMRFRLELGETGDFEPVEELR